MAEAGTDRAAPMDRRESRFHVAECRKKLVRWIG
jgi:hypothetical protein